MIHYKNKIEFFNLLFMPKITEMSYYQFSREDLKLVVDTDLIKECENEFARLWPKPFYAATNNSNIDRYDYQYWSFIGCCERVAILIIYPMIKLLYPHLKIKLLNAEGHSVIVTDNFSFDHIPIIERSRDLSQPLIFDPISLTLNWPRSWIFNNIHEYGELIEEENISEWYTCEIFNGRYDYSCDIIANLYLNDL